ncbi:MFS transporter [Agromyces mangrovi Wang et al. 2018]|uniref:MFS transporter n=1 Tax=Agromyces mangrovi TaxID=1858653 RepID=UPI0025737225|nr:MFS transporter [Agromyces mangrovi]BDZ64682.1 hypothetical protein GCM10025877_16200 [Agromyces mangrovi]
MTDHTTPGADPGAAGATVVDVAPPPTTPTKADGALPRAFSLRFSTRGISLAVDVIVMMQLTFYATDIVGLPAALVGGIFLAAKLFDGFTDLFVGFVIDRTKSRWGKARPYELFIIPAWLLTVAIFSTPDMDTFWQAAYLFVMYALIQSVCHTVLNGSEGVYLKRSLKGEVRYAKVLARQGVFIILVAGVASVILPMLMATWGTEPGGWTRIALVYAVPMMILGLVRFFTVKELPEDEVDAATEQRVSVKDALKALVRNKYIFIIAAMVLLSNIIANMNTIVGAYFFKYVLGDLALLSIVALAGLIMPVIYLLFPLAVRTIGAVNFLRVGLALAMVGFALVAFFPTSLVAVAAGQLLGSFTSIVTLLVGFFVIQAMRYGEWKTGRRIDAVTNSVTSFTSKIGSGLASAGVGLMMGIVGYNGLAASQTAEAEGMIVGLYSWVPFVLTAGMLAISFTYKLDRHTGAIETDLAAGIHADTSELKL